MVVRSGILNHTFPVAVAAREVTLNQDLRAAIPYGGIEPRYLALLLRRLQRHILDECSKDGTTVASVEPAKLESALVPVAPLAEQRRVVARIDELFTEIADGEAALARAHDDLDTWRRALLKAAVTGQLTGDWRKACGANDSAAELLSQIQSRRSQDDRPARVDIADVARCDRFSADLPMLPPSWTWTSLDSLTVAPQRNGISIKGSATPPGTMALRLDALTTSGLDLSAVRYIPLSADRIRTYAVRQHDFLVSRANGSASLVGRANYVRDESGYDFVFPDTMIRYPLFPDRALGEWVEFAWASPFSRLQILRRAKTTAGILKISQDDIAQVALPIPPYSEMCEIIERVHQHEAEKSDGEEHVRAASQATMSFRQSILKAAFNGYLVDQDPNDEPAQLLLDRVKALREANPGAQRKSRTLRQRKAVA